jgi:hypothetical protein
MALGIWRACSDPRTSTLAESFFASRGIVLPDDVDGGVLRFHPALKLGDHRAPALVWLARDVFSDEPVAIHRVYLSEDGNVIARRAIGRLYNTAVKLDPDEHVTTGLHVCIGVETAVAAMSRHCPSAPTTARRAPPQRAPSGGARQAAR